MTARRKRWTLGDETALREMHAAGIPISQMSKELDRTEGAINHRLCTLGLGHAGLTGKENVDLSATDDKTNRVRQAREIAMSGNWR